MAGIKRLFVMYTNNFNNPLKPCFTNKKYIYYNLNTSDTNCNKNIKKNNYLLFLVWIWRLLRYQRLDILPPHTRISNLYYIFLVEYDDLHRYKLELKYVQLTYVYL